MAVRHQVARPSHTLQRASSNVSRIALADMRLAFLLCARALRGIWLPRQTRRTTRRAPADWAAARVALMEPRQPQVKTLWWPAWMRGQAAAPAVWPLPPVLPQSLQRPSPKKLHRRVRLCASALGHRTWGRPARQPVVTGAHSFTAGGCAVPLAQSGRATAAHGVDCARQGEGCGEKALPQLSS